MGVRPLRQTLGDGVIDDEMSKNGSGDRNGQGREKHEHFADRGAPDTDRIARHLKEVYDETVQEPLPENLKKLLELLDSRG
jgi:Anti-sigma factor NepR